ncbi:NAD(P)H--quinone oxidoreductase [Zopfochytrium polystomum]|nr:NAD(P)H--quinone oxidoreductase [Zopfochytrium polystomum]
MSIAVSAATSQLGKIIVDILHEKNLSFVALVRDPSKVRAGVETRKFDYNSDAATLAASLTGVKTLILISSGDVIGDRVLQHKNAVDAAKQAGVTTVVYTSLLHAPTSEIAIAGDHKTTEEYIAAAPGLKHVFLRNGWYLENWTGKLDTFLKSGALLNSLFGAKVSPATRRDYAEAAVAAAVLATEGKPVKAVYELGGEAITLEDLTAEISVHAGKEIKSVVVPVDELRKQFAGFGLPPKFVEIIASTDAAAAKGGLYVEPTDLIELIGRQPDNWKQHVKEVVAALPSA